MPEAMPVLEVAYPGAAESGSALVVVLFWLDEFSGKSSLPNDHNFP